MQVVEYSNKVKFLGRQLGRSYFAVEEPNCAKCQKHNNMHIISYSGRDMNNNAFLILMQYTCQCNNLMTIELVLARRYAVRIIRTD